MLSLIKMTEKQRLERESPSTPSKRLPVHHVVGEIPNQQDDVQKHEKIPRLAPVGGGSEQQRGNSFVSRSPTQNRTTSALAASPKKKLRIEVPIQAGTQVWSRGEIFGHVLIQVEPPAKSTTEDKVTKPQLDLNRPLNLDLNLPPPEEESEGSEEWPIPEVDSLQDNVRTHLDLNLPPAEEESEGSEDRQMPEVDSVQDHVHTHQKIRKLVPGEGESGQRGKSSSSPKASGICRNTNNNKWEANFRLPGVQVRKKPGWQIYLGSFNTETEAKQVHDKAAIKLSRSEWGEVLKADYGLHFPDANSRANYESYLAEYEDWNFRDFVWNLRRWNPAFTTGQSGMKGVKVIMGKRTKLAYTADISHTYNSEKKLFKLGKFKSLDEAGKAYDRALLFINKHVTEAEKFHCITNFRPSTYSTEEILQAGRTYELRAVAPTT